MARSTVVSDSNDKQDIRTSYGSWLNGEKRDAKVLLLLLLLLLLLPLIHSPGVGCKWQAGSLGKIQAGRVKCTQLL